MHFSLVIFCLFSIILTTIDASPWRALQNKRSPWKALQNKRSPWRALQQDKRSYASFAKMSRFRDWNPYAAAKSARVVGPGPEKRSAQFSALGAGYEGRASLLNSFNPSQFRPLDDPYFGKDEFAMDDWFASSLEDIDAVAPSVPYKRGSSKIGPHFGRG